MSISVLFRLFVVVGLFVFSKRKAKRQAGWQAESVSGERWRWSGGGGDVEVEMEWWRCGGGGRVKGGLEKIFPPKLGSACSDPRVSPTL